MESAAPVPCCYARFEREDAARQQIVHYYVPKLAAAGQFPRRPACGDQRAGVVPRHLLELLFRRTVCAGFRNLAESRAQFGVGCHALATNSEVLASAGR